MPAESNEPNLQGTEQPRVTLLVIAYQMRATIEAAIASALAQDYPCEIIVSDDASTDGTLDAARDLVAAYRGSHTVRVLSTGTNVGLCTHLNQLAGVASGALLVFLAGDDIAYPTRVSELVAAFAENPDAQLVGSAVDEIDLDGKIIRPRVRALPARVDQDWLLRRGKMTTILGASMGLRREILTGFPPLVGPVEDNMLMLRAALISDCICLPNALLGYRRHAGNFGKWIFDRKDDDFATFERRNRRVIALYRDIAADQRRCVEIRTDLPEQRRCRGFALADMYALEADMREAILDLPRRQWIPLLLRGMAHPGLRHRSLERTLKLFAPRRYRLRR